MRFFIRNVGAIEVDGRMFRTGIKGQSDVYGYVRGSDGSSNVADIPRFAIPFEVELKNVRTRETEEQTAWAMFCQQWGIPRLMLRALRGETPEKILSRWTSETGVFLHALKSDAIRSGSASFSQDTSSTRQSKIG